MTRWLRKIHLEIEPEGEGTTYRIPSGVGDDLHMDFEVNISDSRNSNSAIVSVYNIGYKNSADILRDKDAKKYTASLFAGYDDTGQSLLISGDLVYMSSVYQRPDLLTSIYIEDGYNLSNIKYKKRHKKGTYVTDIINDICYSSGYVFEYLVDSISEKKILRGVSFKDTAFNCISEICTVVQYDFYESNKMVHIYDPSESSRSDSVVKSFNPGVNIIGTPTVSSQVKNLPSRNFFGYKKLKRGEPEYESSLMFTTQLDPSIKPSDTISIQNDAVAFAQYSYSFGGNKVEPMPDGNYMVRQVKHMGSNYENSYYTNITCSYID